MRQDESILSHELALRWQVDRLASQLLRATLITRSTEDEDKNYNRNKNEPEQYLRSSNMSLLRATLHRASYVDDQEDDYDQEDDGNVDRYTTTLKLATIWTMRRHS